MEQLQLAGESARDQGVRGADRWGRIKEYADDGADITRIYRHLLVACTHQVLPGLGKHLR